MASSMAARVFSVNFVMSSEEEVIPTVEIGGRTAMRR
jgi:hypothetical protein